MKKVLVLAGALMFVSSAAFASVTLKNEDTKNYDLEVMEGQSTKHTMIASGTTVPNQCSADCKITIKGGASFNAKNGQTVIIKDGNFSAK